MWCVEVYCSRKGRKVVFFLCVRVWRCRKRAVLSTGLYSVVRDTEAPIAV